MIHKQAASAQVGLSYFFLVGFFACAILEAVGVFKTTLTNELKDGLMLVMSFWFMRQRNTADDEGPSQTTSTTTSTTTPLAPTPPPEKP
jgi:hypothetical protein